MKNMKKGILSVIITALMLVSILPTAVFAADTTYDLYIGGVQFTSDNLVIDSADSAAISGSATYNPELNTLTLNNFQYSGPGYKNEEYEYLYGALRVEGDNDLHIVFSGQNVIECTSGDEVWGLYTDFNGDLYIKAADLDSSLTLIGGDVACGRSPMFDGSFAIFAGSNEADATLIKKSDFDSSRYTFSYVKFTAIESPDTGDNFHIILWALLMSVGAVCIAASTNCLRKKALK